MKNLIIVLIIGVIVGGIVLYLIRAKRKGQKCIGCPYCKQCSGNCSDNQQDK